MPVQVYEDILPVDIEILEAIPLTPEDPEEYKASYPFPLLRATGKMQPMRFGTVVLENDYSKVTVLPALGGRITSLVDKRTGQEILPQNFEFRPGGSRGVQLHQGIEFNIGHGERLQALGPVDYQIEDDEDTAGVWLSELQSGTGLSWHVHLSLSPDRAEIRLALKVFNRQLTKTHHDVALRHPFGYRELIREHGLGYYDSEQGTGMLVYSEEELGTSENEVFRKHHPWPLAPHQLDSWDLSIVPVSGLQKLSDFLADGTAVSVQPELLQVQVAEPKLGGRVFLGLTNEHTLEAPADLYPEKTAEYSLPSGVGIIALRDASGTQHKICLSPGDAHKAGWLIFSGEFPPGLHLGPFLLEKDGGDPAPILRAARHRLGDRAYGELLFGYMHSRRGQYAEAAGAFETALLFNAEDHLAWWSKAVMDRLSGAEGERAELLNAHYLAPLEPLLRVESFLSQVEGSTEASALTKPLADNPEALLDSACMLLELGLHREVIRWVEEALRHREVPMLRYLAAFALLEGSTMQVEAAQQVGLASKAPINPPYPWRRIEKTVLERLSKAFKDDVRIKELLRLMDWAPNSFFRAQSMIESLRGKREISYPDHYPGMNR